MIGGEEITQRDLTEKIVAPRRPGRWATLDPKDATHLERPKGELVVRTYLGKHMGELVSYRQIFCHKKQKDSWERVTSLMWNNGSLE